MDYTERKQEIQEGRAVLGIELGSTRIKAVLIGRDHKPIAEGSHTWENQLSDGIWTYSLEAVENGLQQSFSDLMCRVEREYGCRLMRLAGIGVSAMMHGYLAFGEEDELLVPFRTWRNTITKEAAGKLTELFHYNIPQRWSVAHLYQAVLNREAHVAKIRSVMTLAEYVHWRLTGKKVIGIGDASGMFPINLDTRTYDQEMIDKFNAMEEIKPLPWKLEDLLPKTLLAGEDAGQLTREGAAWLDPTGTLQPGAKICPPEGDAQTGMIATNSIRVRTGNVSAGTSDFAIIVLEKELSDVYTEIDLVTSPTGKLAANIHCNNCTTDLNAWAGLFREFAEAAGAHMDDNELYGLLYRKALEGEADGGGLLAYNYYSGEGITDLDEGRPLLVRKPDSVFNLGNLMRTNLYASLATLKIGMDILLKKENVKLDRIMAHGGLFKTKGVGQRMLAAALNTPITVMETANFGGAWGIALLAQYAVDSCGLDLETWVEQEVFVDGNGDTMDPVREDVEGFSSYLEKFQKGLAIQRQAIESFR